MRFLFRALLLLVVSVLSAQTPPLTIEWANSDAAAECTRMPSFAWTASGDLLYFDTRKPPSERTLERIRPSTGERKSAVDARAALTSLKALLGEAPEVKELPWPEDLDRAGRRALYAFAGDLFLLDLEGSRFTRLTRSPEPELLGRLSPDGSKVSFVRTNDLYVMDLATGAERRLTRDGSATVLNGALSWVYWEEIFDHDAFGYWWSDDSSAIAFLRTDESPVSLVSFVGFTPEVPQVLTQRYPKAGGANPEVRLGVVDVADGRTAWMDRREAPYEYILGVSWFPDAQAVAVQTTERSQTRLDLWKVARADGKVSKILQDPDEGWVNQKEIQFLEGGKKLLVSSERSGHTHLYRFKADGTFVNPVTQGAWSVRGPGGYTANPQGSAWVDEGAGLVYFTALEKSSVERHLYRVRLDGSGMKRVTQERGTHSPSFSPDRRYYVDIHSDRDTLPSLTLREANGALRMALAPSLMERLAPFQLQKPELFTVPAADGFPLPVRVLKPKDFDPGRKYPVIVYVYGGPSSPTVRDAWDYSFAGNAWFDQILVREGFVVVSIDNRSATGISKKLENTVAKQLWGDLEAGDILAGVAWFKAQPWVDGDRLGIWGWSGGGTSTLSAMTRSKVFKAGIAIAPSTNWYDYDTKFTEAYMKTPAENPEGYAQTSLVRRAKHLHGRLLLVHGTGDDNVHPQHSWRVVEELIQANKPFDLMMYPMRKHTINDRPARIHLFNTMLAFWKLRL